VRCAVLRAVSYEDNSNGLQPRRSRDYASPNPGKYWEKLVNLPNFAPLLMKVKFQVCCVMKMRTGVFNTFLDMTSF